MTRFIRRPGDRLLIALVILFAAVSSRAQYELHETPFADSSRGTIAIGGALRVFDDLYIGADDDRPIDFDIVPLYHYNGKHLFARGTAGGVHLFRNDHIEVNALFRWRFEMLDPESREIFADLDRRKQTLDGGLELRLQGDWGRLNLNYLTDTLGRHDGQSAGVSYFAEFERGGLRLSPFVGWSWYSSDLANYYYGVSDEEAAEGRPAYVAGDSHWLSIGLNTSWQVGQRGMLFTNIGLGAVDTAIADSPLVDTNVRPVVFAGGSYSMGSLLDPGEDLSAEHRGDWSWRINYGYAANGNLVGNIDQGEVGPSNFAHSTTAGITFAKLFREGPRTDARAKFSVYRHFERDDGNGDFFSFAAYVTITGKGFSAWSGKELFRYALGYGISYANEVPIHEQRKQTKQGDTTSHFMNYLELQLDFPLRILFRRSEGLKDCYSGITVTHRSGVWGASDVFSRVNGGSNWITAHLECTVGS
jgi:outer membrane protein